MTKSWKWIKRVLWFFLGLLVLLFLAVSILVYVVNSESYLEDYLTDTLGVEAHIGELDVSLLSGTVAISSSTLGPKDNPFLSFESLKGELDYSQLWSSRLTVELLELNNTKARYPFDFQLKSSENAASEETNLPFDYIDVAAIDVNNLDFIYSDGFSLEAKGTDIQVRNLPVADSGFLLFEDLDRLVKASQTTVDAKVTALTSDKSQLNDLELHAYVENKQLIIDSLKSGQSSLTLNLLDYSESSAKTTDQDQATDQDRSTDIANASSKTEEPLELPFNDIIVKTIDLGKTDLEIQDQESLSVNAIEAHFSELLLVKDKQALWLDWPKFYQEQDSEFRLNSEALKSDIFDFESMELAGTLKNGEFTLPDFVVKKPVVKLELESSTEQQPAAEPLNLHLPFSVVTLVNGEISQGKLELKRGGEEHTVNNIDIKLSNLPLIRQNRLIYHDNKLTFGPSEVTLTVNNSSYDGHYGQLEKLSTDLTLKESDVAIKTLKIDSPSINYELPENSTATTSNNTSDSSSFPLDRVYLQSVQVNDASFEVNDKGQSYNGKNINVKLDALPIYNDGQWTAVDFEQWREMVTLELDAQSVVIPQGSLNDLILNASMANNSATVERLTLGSSDLTINAQADDKQQENSTLPIDSVQLNNVDMEQVDLVYKNEDIQYRLLRGHLKLDRLPLIRKGVLVSDPMEFMKPASNNVTLSAAEVETPEGIVRGLSLQGVLSNQDLMLDYVRTESADIELKVEPNDKENQQSDDSVAQTNDGKAKNKKIEEDFILRTVKIGDVKLENINVNIETATGEASSENSATETLAVKNLYLGATELILAKNHQTIDQWYGSQLENAFTLVALKVEHIQQAQNDVRDLTVTAVQSAQQITVQPMRLTYNEAPLSAKWVIDLTTQPYQSSYLSRFQGLSLEKLIDPADDKSVAMTGLLDGQVDIKFQGLDAETVLSSLNGSTAVTNRDPIILHRLNVNKVLRSFLDSQNFGLLDLGGFLLAGPLGLLASQGVSLQDTLSQLGADQGDTHFTHLNVDVDIADGVITTKDVAAATLKYRFAFNGVVDLGQQKFKDFEFDIINEKGCSEYGQTLNGNLTSPDIETFTAAFDAVTGSIVGLFKQGVGLITGGACSAVYEGVVPHPEDGAEIIKKEQQKTYDPDAPDDDSEEEPSDSE